MLGGAESSEGKSFIHYCAAQFRQNKLFVRLLTDTELYRAKSWNMNPTNPMFFHASPEMMENDGYELPLFEDLVAHNGTLYTLGRNSTNFVLVQFGITWNNEITEPKRLSVEISGRYVIPSRKAPVYAAAMQIAVHHGLVYLEFRYRKPSACKTVRLSLLSIIEERYEGDELPYMDAKNCDYTRQLFYRIDELHVMRNWSNIALPECRRARKMSIYYKWNALTHFEKAFQVSTSTTPFALNTYAFHRRMSSPFVVTGNRRAIRASHMRFAETLAIMTAFALSWLLLHFVLSSSRRYIRRFANGVVFAALADSDEDYDDDDDNTEPVSNLLSQMAEKPKDNAQDVQDEVKLLLAGGGSDEGTGLADYVSTDRQFASSAERVPVVAPSNATS